MCAPCAMPVQSSTKAPWSVPWSTPGETVEVRSDQIKAFGAWNILFEQLALQEDIQLKCA